MKNKEKTFYLWDMANTLFPEEWNKGKSGFEDYDAYIESLGYNLETISDREYEENYKIPYETGLFKLDITKGYKEVLSETKENYVFTTGIKEQTDWRAIQLNPKVGFNIKDYLVHFYSTFDYGNTNKKTPEMLIDILKKKWNKGFKRAVYTDDKEKNCGFFLDALKQANKQGINITARVYKFNGNNNPLKKIAENYYEAGNLFQILENENN